MAGFDWGALIGAAATYFGSKQAGKGTQAQIAGQQAGIDEQRREYDQSRNDQMPWLTAGGGALGQMQALNSGDMTSFHNSPDYQFAYDNGLKTLDRSAASRGRLDSGGYGQDLVKYGQGMAEQNYNNYYNRLQSMAGQGQTTASGLGTLGQNMANSIGQQYTNMGALRQSGYDQTANMYAGLGGMFNNWYQKQHTVNGGT